jgi:hypothetical protein
MTDLLPHLANVARQARVDAGLTYAHVAVHVRKRDGRSGVSESTVARFEYAALIECKDPGRARWPENPDAMLSAYAIALGHRDPYKLWRDALDAARKARREARAAKR